MLGFRSSRRRAAPPPEPNIMASEVGRQYASLSRQIVTWCSTNGGVKRLGVTAGRNGVGTTTVSEHLAILLAQGGTGKVLLVDGNLDAPALSQKCQAVRRDGLAEALVDGHLAADLTLPTNVKNLRFLPAGRQPLAASYLLERFDDVLASLLGSYSYVIVDLPPASELTPCMAMAPLLDGVLFVCGKEDLNDSETTRSKRQLEQAGARLIGAVLNGE